MISLYFGNIGSGKSTILAKLASKAENLGYQRTFSNVPIKGTILIKSSDLGFYDFSNSLVLLDEGGIDFNNRFYAKMPLETIQFLKLSRHYNCDIAIVSQSFDDIDITFRRLCDKLYYVWRISKHFTSTRQIVKSITIDEDSKQIIDSYDKVRFSFRPVFMPKYWKMFDSYSAPVLPPFLHNTDF